MGRAGASNMPLIKVVLQSKFYRRALANALANARHLRGTGYVAVLMCKKMTAEKRKNEYELRQQVKKKNKD